MATKTDNGSDTISSTHTMPEGLLLQSDRGFTSVADDVVAKLAGHACREVEGVVGMGNSFRRLLGRVRGDNSLSQGVHVEVGKREAAVDIVIIVGYGYSIPELANAVRDNVIARIESATGLVVKEVNIEVDDLMFEEEAVGSRVE